MRLDVQCNGHTQASEPAKSQPPRQLSVVACQILSISPLSFFAPTGLPGACSGMKSLYLNWVPSNSQMDESVDVEKHSHRRTCKISKYHGKLSVERSWAPRSTQSPLSEAQRWLQPPLGLAPRREGPSCHFFRPYSAGKGSRCH